MNLIEEIMLECIESASPQRLLWIAPAAPAAVEAWLAAGHGREATGLAPAAARDALQDLARFDYALVTGALEYLSVPDGEALIARLRDVHCHRFAVVLRRPPGDRDPAWSDGRLRGLALTLHLRVAEADGGETAIYTYDIDTYNFRREWNTPDNWAHPQNFRCRRW